jgi:hypothetical protein
MCRADDWSSGMVPLLLKTSKSVVLVNTAVVYCRVKSLEEVVEAGRWRYK